jgi:hypothetical protein
VVTSVVTSVAVVTPPPRWSGYISGYISGDGYTSLEMEWRERLDRWTRTLPWSLRRPLAVHAIDA